MTYYTSHPEGEFTGRSIMDLEAERVQLEDELDDVRRNGYVESAATSELERRIDELSDEIEINGHSS